MNAEQIIDEIRRIRNILFPAIGIQIITGFNLYPTNDASSDDAQEITISYLHEDLLEEKLHYMQIKKMLDKYCDQIKVQKLEHEAINRFSSYRLDEGWRAEQYFLIDQTSVKEEDVDDKIRQNITVIGCGKQNELIIKCDKDALVHILEQFRVYANKYKTDPETGRFVYVAGTNDKMLNPNPTWMNAWEIPTIIIKACALDGINAYEKAKKLTFRISDGTLSTIIGDKWNNAYEKKDTKALLIPSFEEYLTVRGFLPEDISDKYFVNGIFFDWLNKIDWKKVEKTIESYGYMFSF